MFKLPNPPGTSDYEMLPFQFTEELSSKNVFVQLPEAFSPVQRMLLQASGNLQRLVSAYFNVPSRVEIIYNRPMYEQSNLPNRHFERKVQIYFAEKMVIEADSILYVKDPNVLDLIEKHKYGLGQIFAHTKRTPDFMLLAVGRHDNKAGSSFWRDYSLTIPDVLDCFIREKFVEGLFDTYDPSFGERKGSIWFNNQ
ncbi:hypothetical protein DM01DRAFT_1407119 [Hesseltinella vesiculosa]|uniref:Uncharacterized protein n=1 Tax=Hesseltinella vesiculosa TaxID=101127 RepID=A0A1X2GJB3_9FUNG|nr:hypothetical protein DM01DRAFT_1407119 [Hesseltinella vesiculosa]